MRITVFSTQDSEREFFDAVNDSFPPELACFGELQQEQTARAAVIFPAVCEFTPRLLIMTRFD